MGREIDRIGARYAGASAQQELPSQRGTWWQHTGGHSFRATVRSGKGGAFVASASEELEEK
jgi:hypothetical protein